MMFSMPCQVADVMATNWPQATSATSLAEVAQMLTTTQASVVVIVEPTADGAPRPVGLVSQTEMMAGCGQPNWADIPARAVMTPAGAVSSTAPLLELYTLLLGPPQRSALVVVNHLGAMVGLVTPDLFLRCLNPAVEVADDACGVAQRSLQLQRDYNHLITAIISRFVDISPTDLDTEIEHTLALVGTITQVNTSYLVHHHLDQHTSSLTHEWCSEGYPPQRDLAQNLPAETLCPWSYGQLIEEKMVFVPDVAALPRAAAVDQALWQQQQLGSLLILPLVYRGQVTGAIGIASRRAVPTWPATTVQLLQVIGQMIVAAQHRIRNEQQLQENEERLRLALSATNQGWYDINLQTWEAVTSAGYAAMLGYDPHPRREDNSDWMERLHPEDRDRVLGAFNRYLAGQQPDYRMEFRQRTRTGSWKWVLSVGKIVAWDEAGTPLRMLGTHTDIDDRKQAELALQASEARFRAFMENSPMTAWITDPVTNRVEYANQSWRNSYALLASDIVGRDLSDLFPPEIATVYQHHNRQVMESKQALETAEPGLRPDGSPGEFLTFKFPLPQPDGRTFVGGVAIDITERQRAEQRLGLQSAILNRIACSEPLRHILEALVRAVEVQLPNSRCSILLCGGDGKLHQGVAPHLPEAYNQAIEGTAIGEAMGSCGTAVMRREPVIVEDIATDPLWADFRELALAHDLRACWSVPVFASDGPVLATFAVYYHTPRAPFSDEIETLQLAANLAKVAIEQDRSTAALEQLNRELEDRVAQRTAALQQSRERLREAQQVAHVGSWEMDLASRAITWSTESLSIFGLPDETHPTPTELRHHHFSEDSWHQLHQMIDQVLASGEPRTLDIAIRRVDGTTGYVLMKAVPLTSAVQTVAQTAPRIFGIVMDISDRHAMQEALRRSEERARATLMAMPDLVFRVNREGIYLDFMTSPQTQNLVDPQAAIGQPLEYNLLPETPADHVPRKYAALRQALATQTVQCYEQQVWIDGKPHYEEVRVAPCGNDEAVFFIRDISNRKQTELELTRSHDLREAIFNESADALFLVNTQTLLTLDCNQRAVELFEADSKANLLNIQGHTLQVEPFQETDLQAATEAMLTQGFWSREIEYRTHKGKIFWGNLAAKPITIAGQALNLVRITDISDRKQAEAELHRTNQELARATRLKDEFLANMSHELRTPLNAILGMAEGLQDEVFGPLNPRQIKALNTIERSGEHLLDLINDILDLAKIESGQISLDYVPVSALYLCQSSLAFIKQQAIKKNIKINLSFPSDLPDLWVDERRIRQVLINLLNNAVKFTSPGGAITLSVKPLASVEPPNNPRLHIAIEDTGIGIAAADMHKLFKPFVQIDSALNRQYNGTGLGLALVKRIVELHGGQVGVTSQVGVGSCFSLNLPCAAYGFSRLQPPSWPESNRETCSGDNTPAAGPVILLAEDNEVNIYTISSYLGAKGYRILLAKTGKIAVEMAKRHRPHLILMDIQMPEIDGIEAIRQIRACPDLTTTPIIALTALAMPRDRERCLAAGANDYLSKPVKLKQLSTAIRRFLSHPRAEQSINQSVP